MGREENPCRFAKKMSLSSKKKLESREIWRKMNWQIHVMDEFKRLVKTRINTKKTSFSANESSIPLPSQKWAHLDFETLYLARFNY